MDFSAERRESLVRYLRRHVAGEVRFDDSSRKLYATDASHYRIEPAGVVVPKSADDLTIAVQIAADLGVPITARGAGTSLTGQSIGPGIVLDCSKFLNHVSEIDPVSRTCRVEPGVVLDQLNREVAAHGLMFGPDVATASRATLGGMIGNNSAGARSVVYGQTVSHIKSLRVVLSDGSRARFTGQTEAEFARKCDLRTLEGGIYRDVSRVVAANAAAIRAAFPTILRKVSGYNLPALLDEPTNLLPLLVGSEGTLGVTADAILSLVPRPKYRGLLVPQFDTLRNALDAVQLCLAAKPTAVELMDRMLLDLARKQRGLKDVAAQFAGNPAAVLMVEFAADDPAAVEHAVEKLSTDLRPAKGLVASITATDAAARDPLWNLRSGAVPLLYGLAGDAKPVTFCEDAAVSPERLPEFADRFRAIFHRHGTDGAFYGHASVGCLHIRPVLNLHDRGDVAKMRLIMADVVQLVREFNGSLSGEHGDGLVRSEWNRPLFGDAVYTAFCDVKRAFDPGNVLNPGKIVHGPRMEENLRVEPGTVIVEPPTTFDYPAAGGFFRSIEACNGSGVCRKTQGGAMCPSYRVTKDEQDTPRGRANALRETVVAGGPAPLADRWLFDVMDLCLGCKACKSECPANVDVAKLKSEFLHAHYARRGRPPGDYLAKYVRPLSHFGAFTADISNGIAANDTVRRVLEAVAGVDRRRSLPELHADHFRKRFRRVKQPLTGREVVLLDDCFTTYQEPHIGSAALALLNRGGVGVKLAGVCCGRALISKGFLTEARAVARAGIQVLYPTVAAGIPILGLEPSCLLTLADEWPELVPGPKADAVAAAAKLAEAWVAEEVHAGRFDYTPPVAGGRVLFHAHCHQKALVGPGGSVAALKLVPGFDVVTLDAGCCGMAGLFGYEKRHFDVSISAAELALAPAIRGEPDAAVCATGTSCRHQIKDVTGRRARHPLEVLAGT